MPSTLLNRTRLVSIPDSCGGTLTAATIAGLTPDAFEAYATTEHSLARVIAESAEARAIGVIPKTMSELLMSRIKEIDKDSIETRKVQGQSIILPYSYRTRKTNIGAESFSVASGEAHASAGTTVGGIVYPTSAWSVVVNTGPSARATALTNIERHFLIGEFLYVENIKSTGVAGVDRDKRTTPFKIINSVNTSSTTATVTIAANKTTAGWAALSAPEKAIYQPTFGVVYVGTNNVRDQESWCYNQPSDLSRSLIVDWNQTSRYTQCYNDEYARILKEITDGNVNEFIKKFQHMPLAEQNKLQRQRYDDKFMHSVFFGDVISEKQTAETYTQLETVADPEDGTVYGYKANAIGLRTLLANEGRVVDMHGGALDLDNLLALSYEVYRNRRVGNDSVEVIDWMTDKDSAHLIHISMIKYLKATYGFEVTQFFKSGEVVDSTTNLVRYKYNRYTLPGLGFDLAVFVEEFFTDRVSQYGNGSGGLNGAVDFQTAGRSIWLIDWSDFNIGVLATNQSKREFKGKVYSDANALYSCVITPNTKHYDLRSTTWTTQIGDAKRSLVVENFSLACPTLTIGVCSPGYVAP
jgi:hypothetical protein